MYFGEKFLLEVIGYTVYMLPNAAYFENIAIYITSPVSLPLKTKLLLFIR